MGRSSKNSRSATSGRSICWSAIGVSLCFAFAMPSHNALAQSQGVAKKAKSPPGKQVAPYKLPHVNVMTKMIQSHMAALGNAIITNNFSVLRDLGTPAFKKVNSTAKLTTTFGPFRKRGLDISTVVLFAPTVQHTPQVDSTGRLRLRGFYQTKPKQVHFDLVFLPVSGKWRMHGIRVNVAPPPQRVSGNSEAVERTIISKVNMRDKPSLSGKLLATLKPGQRVKLLEQAAGKQWRKILIEPNSVGYIKSSVLAANSK